MFLTWKGDHAPRHVHVYKDGEQVVKWNLDARVAIGGHADRKIVRLIADLIEEGRL